MSGGPLPTGTVTFVFTDVEGSTALLEDLGAERYAEALGAHRSIVREALTVHGGVEVDTQGDAFFCAFGSARAAVSCAAEIQERLSATPIRVRVGVHTGEALVVDRHYVGMDVHRAARIGACAHGGQVVLSPATVSLLEPDEIPLRDLGPHRLKDLAAPVVLHQLGDGDFPPLKTLYRTNLPVPATPFLGRELELPELVERASTQGVRILTLTGPGGTGKTRLSLQLAAELADAYADGVWWVPLAPLRESELVVSAVAEALEVEEESSRPLAESIATSVGRRRVLVVLDNCEHVIDAVARLVATVVAACPEVLVVATSREPLAVAGEHVYPVLPLLEDDAVELFHVRARAAGAVLDPAADGVRALCARLDNLPLAVELAAARAAVLPPTALLERLATHLDLLAGPRDADERQRTLRATIGWSYDLLDDREQELFRRLGIFVGGASLAAVEGVCDAALDALLSLVSKSLVRQAASDDGEPRYWMLETIREFAIEKLESSGDLDGVRTRHMTWFASAVPQVGTDELTTLEGETSARLEGDLANLRAAFASAVEAEARPEAVSLAGAVWKLSFLRGRYGEAEEVARRVLGLGLGPLEAAFFHDCLGVVERLLGRPTEALDSYRAAERELEGVAERDPSWWRRWIELKLDKAHFFYFENDLEAQQRVLEELEPAVAIHGSAGHRLDLLHARMQYRYRVERYALSEETEALARGVYELDKANGVVWSDFTLGFCLLWRGKLDEAEAHLAAGLDAGRKAGIALLETRCLVYGLLVMRRQDRPEGARERLAELEALDELHGYEGLVSACAAWLAYRDGDAELVARRADLALREWGSEGRLGYGVFQWTARFPLLGVAVDRGDADGALDQARAMLDARQQPLPAQITRALEVAVASGRIEDFRSALDIAMPLGYA